MQNPIKKLRAGIVAALVLALPAMAVLPAGVAAPNGPAPPFSLPSKGGSEVSLAQYKGQVVMINFWASWCGPCRQEMPLLEDIYKKYNKLGFTLIGVNVEPDSKAADDWLKQTPVTFPVLYDKDSKVSQLFNVSGMPTTVIIDRKGNVRYRHVSYKPGDEGEYLNNVRAMVRE
jgi:peroxiredoxin